MLGVPMFLFLLTAREDRVSAKQLCRLLSRNHSTRLLPHPRPTHLCCLARSVIDPFRRQTGSSAGILFRH